MIKATKFKIGDKVTYTGKFTGNGWAYLGIYTIQNIHVTDWGNYVYPNEVEYGNDEENTFMLFDPMQDYDINLIIDTKCGRFNSTKQHVCNPVQMGFTSSKMICPTCDKEFK